MANLYRLAPDFERKLDRAGLTKAELARRAGVSLFTIFAKLNPSTDTSRRGRMRGINAWKIARVYAAATGQAEEAALDALFVEEDAAS